DVMDECRDRYGDLPLPVERLLWVAAARKLASNAHIDKIQGQGGSLRFVCNPPDLSTWSVLFAAHPNLRFTAAARGNAIEYRLGNGEDSAEAAYRLMEEYEKAAGTPETVGKA
ncbi:MAG: hypothetical protein MJ078_07260, partial [Clostridia bacterium]|nr:hypothetical protein [Clostridia bacterium]